jgi:hypothetical protein
MKRGIVDTSKYYKKWKKWDTWPQWDYDLSFIMLPLRTLRTSGPRTSFRFADNQIPVSLVGNSAIYS